MTNALIASVLDARSGITPAEVARVDRIGAALRESFAGHGIVPEPEQVVATVAFLMERVRETVSAGDVSEGAGDALSWLVGETALAAVG